MLSRRGFFVWLCSLVPFSGETKLTAIATTPPQLQTFILSYKEHTLSEEEIIRIRQEFEHYMNSVQPMAKLFIASEDVHFEAAVPAACIIRERYEDREFEVTGRTPKEVKELYDWIINHP